MHTLTLEQLRATTDAGGITGVTLKALGGAFVVQFDTRKGGEVLLAKARSNEPRLFGNPLQALTLLNGLGLVTGSFNVEEWRPGEPTKTRSRPDRSAALKNTHKAAEHDKWVREQIQLGLAEADDPDTNWVTHEAVLKDMENQRKSLQSRLESKV